MFIARIKLKIEQKTTAYERDKWLNLFINGEKSCDWRYNNNEDIEFIYGIFNDEKEAFEEGKKLYFNLLYTFFWDGMPFDVKIINFCDNSLFNSNYNYIDSRLGNKPIENYISNKGHFYNHYGLEIFEVDKSFSEYDKIESFKNSITGELEFITDHKYDFSKLNILNCEYDKECCDIFLLIEIACWSTDIKVKIPILCRAIEQMANSDICKGDLKKSNLELKIYEDIIKYVDNSSKDMSKDIINKIKTYIGNGKKISPRNKCLNFINRYAKDKCINEILITKIFNDSYNLRSSIVHGDKIDSKNEYYLLSENLKHSVLYLLRSKKINEQHAYKLFLNK